MTTKDKTSKDTAGREAVGGARIVADLFAGLGTFALALEGRVLAAEGARDAALALKAAAGQAQRTLFVDHRDLYRRPLDAGELNRFEAVVLDSGGNVALTLPVRTIEEQVPPEEAEPPPEDGGG